MKTIDDVVIPAAGSKKSMESLTQGILSSQLLPLGNHPVIYYSIKDALDSGIKNIHLIVRDKNSDVEAYVRTQSFSNKINFLYQPQPLGITNALYQARDFISRDYFALVFPDTLNFGETPSLQQTLDFFRKVQANIFTYSPITRDELQFTSGTLRLEEQDAPLGKRITSFTFAKKGEAMQFDGEHKVSFIRVLSTNYFDYASRALSSVPVDDHLPFKELVKNEPTYSFPLKGRFFDTGIPDGYKRALEHFRE